MDDTYQFWDVAQKLGFYDELLRMHLAIQDKISKDYDARHAAMLAAETPAQREERIAQATAQATRQADNMRAANRWFKEMYTTKP